MISALVAALFGKCPACQRAGMYKSFLKLHETCPVCHVRFERWTGGWTIPVVMAYTVAALSAIVTGFLLIQLGKEVGDYADALTFGSLVVAALSYPLCKNLSMGMLYNSGHIFVDPPVLVKLEER